MLMPSILGNDLFDDFFGDYDNRRRAATPRPLPGVMKTDIKEDENEYDLSIELPGYNKEDVNAELNDGYLVITAKVEENNEDDNEKGYIRKERYVGSCSRSFYVGKDLKEEDIKAKFENGILNLTVPKKVEHPVEEKKFIAIEG